MKNSIIYVTIFFSAFFSCSKSIKSEQGAIDVISTVYFNASKGLDNNKMFHVAKINYYKDDLIEVIPNLEYPEINEKIMFIKDTLAYDIGNTEKAKEIIFSELVHKTKPLSVYDKKRGTLFSKENLPNYEYRKVINDTVLFKKKYIRFEINSDESFTRYYIYKTDTILPYSLYPNENKKYLGRIERIDSYNKRKDIFVTLQLIPRKKWDNVAKEMFEYNKYVNEKDNGK